MRKICHHVYRRHKEKKTIQTIKEKVGEMNIQNILRFLADMKMISCKIHSLHFGKPPPSRLKKLNFIDIINKEI